MPSASQPCDRCWSSSSSARDIVGVWQLTCERHAIPTGVSGSAAGVNETPTSEPQMKNIQRRVASHQVLRVASHIHHVVFTGARVFGRAFAEAYKQASASQKYAAANSSNPTASNTLSSAGLTLDEACRILNVSPPRGGQGNLDIVHERFKRLFDLNDPKKGGSFYLQSKVLRARERIEMEVREAREAADREAELKEDWRPRMYKG
ncbi:mitochondrial import inner membrane translocase subunit TIM16 [Friedmanniomyces endolithicus]|nr:mitochondrial import inner membrane translocase subunit TIM16 [Friedmanniomyces endolithicus]